MKANVKFLILGVVACCGFLYKLAQSPQDQFKTKTQQVAISKQPLQVLQIEDEKNSKPTQPPAVDIKVKDTRPLEQTIYIHFSGAVQNPGVYKLPSRTVLYQALKQAGGPLSSADLDALNLTQQLVTNQVGL
tara:strand:- start:29 stop:424 length:396 start_codon:yes stop_codon:yes gene_type:complete